jgi:hypothetical protein
MPAPPSSTTAGLPHGLTLARLVEAVERDEDVGFCLACGAERDGVEPDAEGYPCEVCGEADVEGAQQIVMRFA